MKNATILKSRVTLAWLFDVVRLMTIVLCHVDRTSCTFIAADARQEIVPSAPSEADINEIIRPDAWY